MKQVPSTLLLVCCLALAGDACSRNELRRGPLARLADSVALMTGGLTCTGVESSLLPGKPPHQQCRVERADTAILIETDASGTVIMVSREWMPREGGDYRRVRDRLLALYGLEHVGRPGDDLTFDSTHVWAETDLHILLGRRTPSGRLYLAWILGPPAYP